LSQADPGHAEAYAANAETYIARLQDLDTWIAAQVKQVPEDRRLVVTNHESLGYFADRYGFRVIGTILPSVSSSAESSAQGLARLVDSIKATGAVAIFLETGSNSQLARQIAQESGVKVVTELYSHSLSKADGPAPTYIDMMRYNAMTIVNAIK
jgi:ABC-type Zn uptake system ZnuABC Zn-binding protein ZnuA